MPWQKIAATNDDEVSGKFATLQDEFAVVFTAAGLPPEAVMYRDNETPGAGDFYFSPRAAEIAAVLLAAYGAVECEPPDLQRLAVLVRNEGAPLRR